MLVEETMVRHLPVKKCVRGLQAYVRDGLANARQDNTNPPVVGNGVMH